MITPDYSFGFLFPLVATLFALVAFGIGVALGAAAARRGRARLTWLLGLYLPLLLAQILVGFRASETLIVMAAGFVTGPLGYWFGRGFKPHHTDGGPQRR